MDAYERPPIWTLQARDSVMLEVVASMGDHSDAEMQEEILRAQDQTVRLLSMKEVDYRRLRNALVPQQKRQELALVFDTSRTTSSWYGREVASRVVPLLARSLSCCLMHGDLIIRDQDLGVELLNEFLEQTKDVELGNTNQLYCIYANNLTQRMVEELVAGLTDYEPFVGHVVATNSSRMKDWFSTTLVPAYLKARHVVISGHEDDAPEDADYNMKGWPWEDHRYTCRSLPDMYAHLFLAYKIERRVVPGFESDARFALAAIAGESVALDDLRVELDDEKLEYLRKYHWAGMARAGLDHVGAEEFAEIVRAKISDSYFYKLEIDREHGLSKFNLMIELSNPEAETITRVVAAFEFIAATKTARLITVY